MFTQKDNEILILFADKIAEALFDISNNIPSGSNFDNSVAIIQASENIERSLDAVARSIDLLADAISNK